MTNGVETARAALWREFILNGEGMSRDAASVLADACEELGLDDEAAYFRRLFPDIVPDIEDESWVVNDIPGHGRRNFVNWILFRRLRGGISHNNGLERRYLTIGEVVSDLGRAYRDWQGVAARENN